MTLRQNICRDRRAFSLVELMVALGLMGIFLLLAGQVFVFTVTTFHDAGRRLNNLAISEAAFTQLRNDVWMASRVKAGPRQTLWCYYGRGRTLRWVHWTVGGHGQMSRLTSSGKKNHWPSRPENRVVRGQFKLLPGALELLLTWKGGHRLRVFPTEDMLLARNHKWKMH